ncbi:MAG: hypothetical protein HXY40_10090, partial [Chloroflexi bacterium]|nr:hypothetical protein [Chloroflexota bacterium]
MSSQSFTAHIAGNPNVPTIKEANVRSAPGTAPNVTVLFKAPVGTQNCRVLDVQPDPQGTNLNGKVFQWFRLLLPDNREGWVRDDLLQIIGDGRPFGYPSLSLAAYAFGLTRTAPAVAAPQPAVAAPQPA